MEKIVTKIGDVTIERRVSKSQQGSGGGSNLLQPSIPRFDEQVRSQFTQESSPIHRINPRPIPKNIILGGGGGSGGGGFGGEGGNVDLKPSEFTKTEAARSQDDLSEVDSEESGISLPKVPRFDGAQFQPKNGPDLSKFVGISIERKKKVDIESKPALSKEDLLIPPSVSIKRISEIKKENVVVDEDIEDSLGEDDFEDEAVTLEDDIEEPKEPPQFEEEEEEHHQQQEQDQEEVHVKSEPEISLIDEEEPTVKEELEVLEGDEELKEIKEEMAEDEEEGKEPDNYDLACTDLVELMKKGEIEGEIEDVKDEEIISEDKKDNKRKAEDEDEERTEHDGDDEAEGDKEKNENVRVKKKKRKKLEEGKEGEKKNEEEDEDEEEEDEEGNDEEKEKNIDKSKITNANLRKNIREVMDETKLDEATLAAQRQEAERLKRLQEQQRIIREVQRQIALNRQNQKSQNKVLSLLQGNSQTSILKTSSIASQAQTSQTKSANSVLVKLSNGEQTSLNNRKMMELLKNSKNKVMAGKPPIPKTLLKQGMVTPSVTIAPVAKKEPVEDDKKKKKGDVVTLSSDSEDDCIVLSEEDESEPEEDPTNSGMHTNDKYNLPDEKGRVVVNVGHPESESDLYLAPQIARIIKPHQIGGIRFLYDNVIESVDRFQTSAGFGCILAHSMGLGKTLQIVSFSDIFLRYTPAKTILCIMPINTIQNWLAEFNMWLPKESASEDVRCREFDLFIVNESLKNINSRAKVILDWQKSGGVLLMGYELFRLLSLKKSYKSKKKKKDQEEEDAKHKELIEEVYSALVIPGPDLVICDEGHRIKNSHATTSQALKQIRTKRRIVLTGYPLQNNLLEYWCMVDFVRPNYLGTKTEFSNMFERPIQNGQCIDSTPQDIRLMRYRAHVLHSLLEGFVQRRSHAVLQSTLPEKEEYVLLLRFTPFQRKLYDTFMNEVVRTVAVPNPLKAFAVCCKIWNHPDVLYNFLKKKGEEIDLDLEEALPPSLQIPQYPYGQQLMGSETVNQQTNMAGVTPWPKRGPGSRGGKVRQPSVRRVGRGRKPAATIPPNVSGEKGPDGDSFTPGQYPSNENFEGMDSFQGRNYNQNQFSGGFTNEYNPQTSYHNSTYPPKNSLSNMEDGFQNKRFFQNDSGTTNQYGGNQNFESEPNFNPNSSNDSNLNSSFESNINSSDSTYNQNEPAKSFDYNQDYNAEFYPNNNFQNAGSNYPSDSKSFQGNYFQNSSFQNSENFDYQSSSSNFQGGYERSNPNFQNTSSNPNPGSFQNNTSANFQGPGNSNNFQNTNTTNFQNSSNQSNFQNSGGNNFQNSSNQTNFQSNTGSSFQNSENQTNFQNSGNNFQNSSNSQRMATQTPNFQNNNGSSFPNSSNSTNFQSNSGGNFQNTNNSRTSNAQNTNFQLNPAANFQANRGTSGQTSNFQNTSTNFQDSNSGSNFQPNFQNSDANRSGGNFMNQSSGSNYQQGTNPNFGQGNNYEQGFWQQSNWGSYPDAQKTSSGEFMPFEEGQEVKNEGSSNSTGAMYSKKDCEYFGKSESEMKYSEEGAKPKEEEEEKKEEVKTGETVKKEDTSLPYEWATDLFKNYVTGVIENSSKMEVFFHIVTESIKLGDRLLVFSQSLLTLDLIEDYLHRQNVPDKEEIWAKNRNYFRLDGSTPGLEREKLINEFNSNPNIYVFLVSTRAGSLGINLVGANRVVVFDASWNPCHDTQAVCRVYRYGQRKPCFVYRLVMDSCLEKKIYDRQVNKQGMADRVVDELNPDAHLSIKEVTNLCWDDQEDTAVKDFSHLKDKYNDNIIQILLERCSKLLSKEPFQHESLLIDRKEKKLSQAEKRLAKRSYELEKQAANQPKNIYSFFPNSNQRNFAKPIASVRPMQSEIGSRCMNSQLQNRSKWIPAEVWQKQGMSAQEMTLPLDVVIPTSSPEKTSIVLKAGQRVMVLKSPKGIYMQLENGKIIAIRSAFKVGQNGPGGSNKSDETKKEPAVTMTPSMKATNIQSSKITPPVRPGLMKQTPQQQQQQSFIKPFVGGKFPEKKPPVNMAMARSRQVMGKAKPFMLNRKFETMSPDMKQRLMSGKMGFGNQEDKFNARTEVRNTPEDRVESNLNKPDESSFPEEKVIDSSDEKTEEEKREEKPQMSNSLETLRKVTESISDPTKPEGETKYTGKNFRDFTSQVKTNVNEEVKDKDSGRESGERKSEDNPTQQQGNENVQNWLMNQSYPPMDPYGNYFPGYYAYGPGPGPMMPPYDGFYPPNNYPGHPMGRNSPMIPPPTSTVKSGENTKSNPQQSQLPSVQNVQNSPTPRNPPPVNTPPMYPAYPNPYPYPYNYHANPGFNNQGFPFPNNQTQSAQQPQQQQQPPPPPPPSQHQQPPATNPPLSGGNSNPGPNQPPSYENSMYSAFHRPDAPFQNPDSSYPSPYPRPHYPSSGTPGFFPYNHPYPNYPYAPNFNPYMHPAGYGYPMQNPPLVNNQGLNSGNEGTSSNTNSNSNATSS